MRPQRGNTGFPLFPYIRMIPMAATRIDINQFLELTKQHPVLDVRSPGEYNHAHLPNAVSLPLFTDEERKVVGTTYKQQSRESAIKIGLDYFGPKMRRMVEEAETILADHSTKKTNSSSSDARTILVYCWRGGMRSGAVSWLLDLYGFKVYTLAGGYKKFRNLVLESFKKPYPFQILGGYTGSGKTELLHKLQQQGETIIDLEGIASHKGSAFGNIGMPQQPTQEMFENLLSLELQKTTENPSSPVWLEDESQRIGLINIPGEIWKNMRQSPVYFLDIPFEERLKHITEEYGQLDKEKLLGAIDRIKEKLGGLNAKNATQLLNEGNTLESFRILLKYYDKYYWKGLHNRENVNSLLYTVDCKSVTVENAIPLLHSSGKKPETR